MRSKRSSRFKANNTILRNRIFGPVEEARTQRLSQQLQKLASAPRPEKEERMEVDPAKSGSDQTTNEHSDCKLKHLPCLATADFDTLSSDVQMSDADSDDNLMEL